MTTVQLPQLLEHMHKVASSNPSLTRLRQELDVVATLVASNPQAANQLETVRKSFTGPDLKACPCCNRPY